MGEKSTQRFDIDDERTLAVGIIATETNSDGVARTILRARERGHDVVVTHYGTPEAESVRFARRLGVTVVAPSQSNPTVESLRHDLREHARANGFDGVLFQPQHCPRVDFDRSARQFDDGRFAAECLPEDDGSDVTAGVLVGVPAYNEEATIGTVVRQASEYAREVIVVDDGSSDDTAARAREAGATVVQHDRNRGYGAALKTLFEHAVRRGGQHLVIIDGDGQHNVSDVPMLVERQRETDCDIVIGSRFVDGADTTVPLLRRLGLFVINAATNLTLGRLKAESRIRDTQSGFRVYNRRSIRELAAEPRIDERMGASIDILYHAKQNGYRIEEVGTDVDYSGDNTSTHHPLVHGIAIFRNIIRTIETERPISALGIPGLLLTLVGLGFAFWTVQNYVSTGSFPYGLAISSAFFFLSGIFTTFISIILHSLSRYYES